MSFHLARLMTLRQKSMRVLLSVDDSALQVSTGTTKFEDEEGTGSKCRRDARARHNLRFS